MSESGLDLRFGLFHQLLALLAGFLEDLGFESLRIAAPRLDRIGPLLARKVDESAVLLEKPLRLVPLQPRVVEIALDPVLRARSSRPRIGPQAYFDRSQRRSKNVTSVQNISRSAA